MRHSLSLLASALGVALITAPATAQMGMPGMHMPMPEKKPAPKKKTAAKKPRKKTSARKASPQEKLAASPIKGMSMPMAHGRAPSAAQPMPMDQMKMGHQGMPMPTPAQPAPGGAMPMDHAQMGQMAMPMG